MSTRIQTMFLKTLWIALYKISLLTEAPCSLEFYQGHFVCPCRKSNRCILMTVVWNVNQRITCSTFFVTTSSLRLWPSWMGICLVPGMRGFDGGSEEHHNLPISVPISVCTNLEIFETMYHASWLCIFAGQQGDNSRQVRLISILCGHHFFLH